MKSEEEDNVLSMLSESFHKEGSLHSVTMSLPLSGKEERVSTAIEKMRLYDPATKSLAPQTAQTTGQSLKTIQAGQYKQRTSVPPLGTKMPFLNDFVPSSRLPPTDSVVAPVSLIDAICA